MAYQRVGISILIATFIAAPTCAERETRYRATERPTPSPTQSASAQPLPTPAPSPTRSKRPKPLVRFPLDLGTRGTAVSVLQRMLVRLTYEPGPIDGSYGTMTQQAVYAFEKVQGLERDGLVDRRQMRRILHASPPSAPRRETDDFIDVDIRRQVLFDVRDGTVIRTLPVSTGNGLTYNSTSGPAIAHTPRGIFQIHTKIAGWRISYLGAMYYPSYFDNGYAIHGSSSVPPYPASHGCIRIPMHSAVGFFERSPIGRPVIVHD